MATVASTRTPLAPSKSRDDRSARRKREPRAEIWSNLLRQTREAQARSRTQAVQSRELIVCGGSPEDQRSFVQSLARPPPAQVPGRSSRESREKRPKGEVVLSNRFAYGYGHVTLYSPPQHGTGLLTNDSEEVAKVGVHTVPEPDVRYEDTLRRLLQPRKRQDQQEAIEDDLAEVGGSSEERQEDRRPSIVVLLTWKEPWKFLDLLRRWLQLLSRALLPPNGPVEDPLEILKEYHLNLAVVLQNVEAQEYLERENYKEESFDFISQSVRTCLLPLSAALIYTPSAPPAPSAAGGAPLSEVQKIIYTSLGLDLSSLSAKTSGGSSVRKEELLPKHNVVDRMAIVVPSGWDSLGKIRLLSETFSPEAITEGWLVDINTPVILPPPTPASIPEQTDDVREKDTKDISQTTNNEEQYTFETTGASTPVEPMPAMEPPMSPSKTSRSAIAVYERDVQDPQAHKAPQPPRIEVTTKPEQEFLADMRAQLQIFDEKDRERQRREPGSVPSASTTGGNGGRGVSIPVGESSGALTNLGDVQFNVGGVNYNAVTAEAAIERLRRPTPSDSPRTGTPRPPKREDREGGGRDTPRAAEIDTDKLEEYFHSLMKRGAGGGSSQSTPSKGPGAR